MPISRVFLKFPQKEFEIQSFAPLLVCVGPEKLILFLYSVLFLLHSPSPPFLLRSLLLPSTLFSGDWKLLLLPLLLATAPSLPY